MGFNADFNNLMNDANQYQTAVTDQANATNTFSQEIDSINVSGGSSWQQIGSAYMKLLMILAGAGSQMQSEQLGVKGSAMKVLGDITTCTNDLQQITQSTNVKGSGGGQDLQNEASGLDYMLAALTTQAGGAPTDPSGQPFSQKDLTSFANIQAALGSIDGESGTTASSLAQEFTKIRNEFYIGSDQSGYNPTSTPGSGGSYFFSNGAPSGDNSPYLTSFGEMQTDMGQQGNLKNAAEASKTMVNAFNTNTSTTQSANAAANEEITQISNSIKTTTSFLVDALHAAQDVNKATITNMSR